MAISTIYPGGVNEVNVPAGEKIAISNVGGGIARIYYLITSANFPDAYQLQQTLTNSEVVLGAFAAGQTVKIEAGNSKVLYDTGSDPSIIEIDVDSSPVSGSGNPIASDWAYDHNADVTTKHLPAQATHNGKLLATNGSAASWPTNISTPQNFEVSNNDPYINFDEADASTRGRIILTGNELYINIGSPGGDETGGGTLKIAGYGGANITAFQIRSGSAYQDVFHQGNTTTQYQAQGAQTAQTTDDTLTAAELDTRIITVNQGAAGTSTQTLPLATAMDSYFTGVGNDFGFEFSVINISTNAAEDCTVATNTGWTLVGSMVVESFDADRARSTGRFFARKTGTGAWTLYRIA